MDKNLKSLDFNRRLIEDILIYRKADAESINFDYKDDTIKPHLYLKADLNYRKSRVLREAGTESTKRYLVFTIRHNENVDETDLIKYKDQFFEIESIIPITNEKLYDEICAYAYKADII